MPREDGATLSQRLLPRMDNKGRALAAEVLIATPFIRDCVEDPSKTSLIAGAIAQGGSQYGMQSFDQHLLQLFGERLISGTEALRHANRPEALASAMRGIKHVGHAV